MSVRCSGCGEWTQVDPESREISWEATVSVVSKEKTMMMKQRSQITGTKEERGLSGSSRYMDLKK